MNGYLLTTLLFFSWSACLFAQDEHILPAAERMSLYFPLLRNKNIAVVANQTSLIGKVHLVDSLVRSGFAVKKIFSPEHGFRGNSEAGEAITGYTDPGTGIPVISLYGEYRKPKPVDLKDIDLLVFDIQDVGVRFYTYISTLHYVMEACAENKIRVIVLDRPDPNGFYVDGPVLDTAFRSFVGMHPVPLVHGMTIGEYAQMINGEHWLANRAECRLTVIPCANYTHDSLFRLPVRPSPNLTNMNAVYLYPCLGLFEGTEMSIGRGTLFPFEVVGSPDYPDTSFSFIPQSLPGLSLNPPCLDKKCYGTDLRTAGKSIIENKCINLQWLIDCYNKSHEKDKFFNPFFDKLAGNNTLKEQVRNGLNEKQIRKSWKKDLKKFKQIRAKYLLYN